MYADEIPELVREFLSRSVRSLDELEMVLVIMASEAKWWSAKAAGDELGVSEARARRMLETLASRNLLDIRVSDDVRYQFRPGTPPLEEGSRALLRFYRERPAIVLRWARSLGGGSINEFADAFRFRQ